MPPLRREWARKERWQTKEKMKIDANTRNSNIIYCIDEYVRLLEHREILKEKWFEGKTFEELSNKHHLSVAAVKRIVYDTGDKILLRAAKM